MYASIPDERYASGRQRFGQMIMFESEGITENVRSWRTDVISDIDAALPTDKMMQVLKDIHISAPLWHISGCHQVRSC